MNDDVSTTMSYSKVGRRCHGHGYFKGFRLKHSKRFSVKRLRARFFCLFRVLSRWKCSVKSLKTKRDRKGKGTGSNNSSKRSLMMTEEVSNYSTLKTGQGDCRSRSFGRSNSFYSEAIADCLEFIKRSSLPVEHRQQLYQTT